MTVGCHSFFYMLHVEHSRHPIEIMAAVPQSDCLQVASLSLPLPPLFGSRPVSIHIGTCADGVLYPYSQGARTDSKLGFPGQVNDPKFSLTSLVILIRRIAIMYGGKTGWCRGLFPAVSNTGRSCCAGAGDGTQQDTHSSAAHCRQTSQRTARHAQQPAVPPCRLCFYLGSSFKLMASRLCDRWCRPVVNDVFEQEKQAGEWDLYWTHGTRTRRLAQYSALCLKVVHPSRAACRCASARCWVTSEQYTACCSVLAWIDAEADCTQYGVDGGVGGIGRFALSTHWGLPKHLRSVVASSYYSHCCSQARSMYCASFLSRLTLHVSRWLWTAHLLRRSGRC